MERPTRRRTLRAVGLGCGALLGGCLSDDGADPTGTDDPTDADDPTGTDDPTATEPLSLDGYDVVPFAASLSAPDWYDDEEPPGHVELFASEAAAREGLDFERVPEDRRSEVESFVADTDFASARLLYVGSVGPNTCYRAVEVSELELDDGTLVGAAAAVAPGDGDRVCGQAITFPSSLVRATVDGRPPNAATVTVTDGWGDEETFEVTADLDPEDLPGHVRPEGDPETVPAALDCGDDDFERHGPGVDPSTVRWGLAADDDGEPTFALRVEDLAYQRGETVRVALTNVSDSKQHTGNRHKHGLEVYTEDGWQDVRGWADGRPRGYTDEALAHDPGEGFEWTFEFTEDGVLAGHVHEDDLTVCPGLPAGRYRFVFWEPAVAVAFDLRG